MTQPLLNTCPTCSDVVDVSTAEPFNRMACPACKGDMRVRTTFDHFQIIKEVGIGGMSRVFEAVDIGLGRKVALKILNRECSNDAARIEQFEREARMTANFSHPHIVRVYSVGHDQNYFYIAMELITQGSLDDRIRRGGPVREMEVLKLAEQMVLGLKTAYDSGLIHRDIKPGNVLFADDGTAKLVDFGLALMQGDEDTGELWATPYYVPPEKLYDQPDTFRGDMYSLGATLFHALAGRPPFAKDTNSIEELRKIKAVPTRMAAAAPQVSEETCALVDRLMARKPEMRYASYDELLEHIRYARKRLTEGGRKTPGGKPVNKRQRQIFAAAAGAAALLLATGIGLWISRRGGDQSGAPTGLTTSDSGTGSGGKSTTERFLQARQMLLDGHAAKAQAEFHELARNGATRQPTLNWTLFNEGLSALFAGDAARSLDPFREIASQPAWTPTTEDASLAAFFAQASELLQTSTRVPETQTARFPADGVTAVGLLACGLKNWELGDAEAAAPFFAAFQQAKTPASAPWLDGCKKLLAPYLDDLAAMKKWPELKSTTGLEESKQASKAAGDIVTALKVPHGMKAALEKKLTAFRADLAQRETESQKAASEEMQKKSVEELAALESLIPKLKECRTGLKFQQAVDLLKSRPFETATGIQQRDDLLYLWQNAEDFLKTLSDDLNTRGYSGDIDTPSGMTVKGAITRASREKWAVRSGLTDAVVDVANIPPAFLASLGDRMLDTVTDSAVHYRRREMLFAFAWLADLAPYTGVATEMLQRELPGFKERWGRLEKLATR